MYRSWQILYKDFFSVVDVIFSQTIALSQLIKNPREMTLANNVYKTAFYA